MGGHRFQTTRWSLVLAARETSTPESREALSRLCEVYWYPLYAFVRRQGHDAEAARDLTQAYFVRLLEKKYLDAVDPDAGRFRSFLLVSLKHFLSNERDRADAAKRGGGRQPISLDAEDAENRYLAEPVENITAEVLYERKWAATVLQRARVRLRDEHRSAGKPKQHDTLRSLLTSGEPKRPYREVAEELGISEAAVKMAVRRMRVRFGELLRDEIAQTVAAPEDVDGEIRHLLSLVRGQ